jgi:hypothetical protein
MWVLDLYYGLKAESTFTTFTSGDDLNPTAFEYRDGLRYHADKNGYTYKWVELNYSDLVVDTSTSPDNWWTKAVPWDMQTVSHNFGSDVQSKWTTYAYVDPSHDSNLGLQISSMDDNIEEWVGLQEKRFRSNLLWGDTGIIWGDADVIWGYSDAIKIKRRFPAGSTRCVYKALRFQPSYTVIANSDNFESATVDSVAKTLTLATKVWPENCEGYYIHVEDDSYADDLEVTGRTDTVLTVTDDNGTLVDGSKKWLLKGYRKGEVFKPLAHTVRYAVFGESYDQYATAEDSTNV